MAESEFVFPEVVPYLYYDDATAAFDWLLTRFGFEEHSVVRGEDGAVWNAQLRTGPLGLVMIGPSLAAFGTTSRADGALATCRTHVLIDDVDAHYARSVAAGVQCHEEPADHGPVRIYIASDLGSHQWIFAQPIVIE